MILRLLAVFFLLGNCATTSVPSSISITRDHGFHVLNLDLTQFPKSTVSFDLVYNGFPWHRYRIGEKIMLVKVTGTPNSVALTPLDAKGNALEAATVFHL
jgi:hypothetical protein